MAACASYDLPVEQLDSVRAGRNAILITSYVGDLGCSSVELNLREVGSGRRYLAINGRPMELTSTDTAVLVVAPGEYLIDSGRCIGQDFVAELPLLRFWFPKFAVAPGEVLNLGALTSTQINFSALRPESALNLLRGDRERRTYLSYAFSDNTEAVRDRLSSEFPEFVGRMETRPPQATLTDDEFRGALARAYQPSATGEAPPAAEADARVGAELEALLKRP